MRLLSESAFRHAKQQQMMGRHLKKTMFSQAKTIAMHSLMSISVARVEKSKSVRTTFREMIFQPTILLPIFKKLILLIPLFLSRVEGMIILTLSAKWSLFKDGAAGAGFATNFVFSDGTTDAPPDIGLVQSDMKAAGVRSFCLILCSVVILMAIAFVAYTVK